MRTFLRTGEVAVITGASQTMTAWQIWCAMTTGEEGPTTGYAKWQGRLAPAIMQGIASDFGFKIEKQLDPAAFVADCGIMAPKAWAVAPHERSRGRPSALIITQRTGQSMREWSEPDQIPAGNKAAYQAAALAYGLEVVHVGVLVDGYLSKVFTIELGDEGPQIKEKVQAFISSVINGEEPGLDFTKDAIAIKTGAASIKLEASAPVINELSERRQRLSEELGQKDRSAAQAKAKLAEVDTQLLAFLNARSPIETDKFLLVLDRDARGGAKPVISPKSAPALF